MPRYALSVIHQCYSPGVTTPGLALLVIKTIFCQSWQHDSRNHVREFAYSMCIVDLTNDSRNHVREFAYSMCIVDLTNVTTA